MVNRRLLIFIDYFSPGYKAGGPIRSVQSVCDALSSDIDIYLITRNNDLGSAESYSGIQANIWVKRNHINLMYINDKSLSIRFIKQLIKDVKPNVIHLNSLMSLRFSFFVLLAIQLGGKYLGKVLLSPRGELSDGALALKSLKKKIYLRVFRILRFQQRVQWIASSDGERDNIFNAFGHEGINIERVNNLPNINAWKSKIERVSKKQKGHLKIVFFSRISKMKNLEFLLHILENCRLNVSLSIYGPKENIEYYELCKKLVEQLPKTIVVSFHNPLEPNYVYETLKEFDLFVLPTLGENFGQAIWEALASSVPVLISDRTPWKYLSSHGVGFDISLNCPDEFVKSIRYFHGMSEAEHQVVRGRAREYALDYVFKSDSLLTLKNLYSS